MRRIGEVEDDRSVSAVRRALTRERGIDAGLPAELAEPLARAYLFLASTLDRLEQSDEALEASEESFENLWQEARDDREDDDS